MNGASSVHVTKVGVELPKPIVTFESVYPPIPELNGVAIVTGLKGHPSQASGDMVGETVRTSRIVAVKTNAGALVEFETLNTIYRPETSKQ